MRDHKACKFVMSFIFIFFAAGNSYCAALDPEGLTSLQGGVYFNEKSMSRLADGTVCLWVKIIPEEGSDLMYEARDHLIQDGKVYQALKYKYTGLLSEIDCSGKKHRELNTIMYDVNNNIVNSVDTSSARWKDISPGTSFERLIAAVCN